MPNKFQKVLPKLPWTEEYTRSRIISVSDEINEFNRMVNDIDSQVSNLLEQKMIIRIKIGNKTKYINQLKEQIEGKASSVELPNDEASVATESE